METLVGRHRGRRKLSLCQLRCCALRPSNKTTKYEPEKIPHLIFLLFISSSHSALSRTGSGARHSGETVVDSAKRPPPFPVPAWPPTQRRQSCWLCPSAGLCVQDRLGRPACTCQSLHLPTPVPRPHHLAVFSFFSAPGKTVSSHVSAWRSWSRFCTIRVVRTLTVRCFWLLTAPGKNSASSVRGLSTGHLTGAAVRTAVHTLPVRRHRCPRDLP